MTIPLLVQIFPDTDNIKTKQVTTEYTVLPSGLPVQPIRTHSCYQKVIENAPTIQCEEYLQFAVTNTPAEARELCLLNLEFAKLVGLSFCDELGDLKAYVISETVDTYSKRIASICESMDVTNTCVPERMLVIAYTNMFKFVALLDIKLSDTNLFEHTTTVLIANSSAIDPVDRYIRANLAPPESAINFIPKTRKFETLH